MTKSEYENSTADEAEACGSAEGEAAQDLVSQGEEETAETEAETETETETGAEEEEESFSEKVEEVSDEVVNVGTRRVRKGDIFKFCGLIAFFVVIIVAIVLLWPYIGGLFEEGGIQGAIEGVQDSGIIGVLLLLALQFLQIVVAFIPGEVVQLTAGVLYGPWFGALIIIVGCFISSAFVFVIVRKLGAPFVQDMVSTKYLEKFQHFEESGKLDVVVFVLFLIPGMPKDVFTYLVPLTNMRMGKFLLLANVARIPGIIVSTYGADAAMDGHYIRTIVLFAIVAAIAIVAFLKRDAIMDFLDKHFHHKGEEESVPEDDEKGEGLVECKSEEEEDAPVDAPVVAQLSGQPNG